jgi:hypothetical protein
MMKSPTRQFAALTTTLALISSGFVPLSSAQADAEFAAFDPSTILRSPAPQTVEVLAFDMNRIVTTQTRLIRYQATEYQRKVAESRARAYVAAQRREIAAERPSAPAKKSPKTSKNEPKPTKDAPKREKPQVAEKPRALPRYIAVDTVKDKRASPKAKKVVMIWDTQAEVLVGNNIYDVQNPPSVGAMSVFETHSAQYIGAGL